MKIYTKTGDQGETGLFGGKRVSKASLRVEAYGTLDELNCVMGIAHSELGELTQKNTIEAIQHQLFCLGAEVATVPEKSSKLNFQLLGHDEILVLEHQIDAWQQALEPLKQFILPGGSKAAACVHHARAVCRRAERLIVELAQQETVRNEVIVYVNRLSDWLFVFARFLNKTAGCQDIPWSTKK